MSVLEYRRPQRVLSPSDNELASRDINLSDEMDRRYLRSVIADAQGDPPKSWLNYRRTPEVRYAISRSSRIAGYAKLKAVQTNPKGEIVQEKDSGRVAEIVQGIYSPYGGVRGLIERFYALTKIPGQAFLTGLRTGPDGRGDKDGFWFLSASEINYEGDAESLARNNKPLVWRQKRVAGSDGDNKSFERLIQPADFRGRVWMPDHEFTEDVNSPMQALNSMCDDLHTLTETITGRLRQRFALAGILLIPNEINDAAISGKTPRDGLYSSDKVMNYLIHIMTTNVVNHAQGIAQIPILLKGPAAVLDKVKHIVMEAMVAETDLKLRAELIDRILTGLDQQKGAITGGQGENHWRGWLTSDEERRITVQPDLEMMCHALTRMVLWRALRDEFNWKPGKITQWHVWYDLSAASVRSNGNEDARQLWDRGGISGAYLRQIAGASETDAMDPNEYIRWVGVQVKNPVLMAHGLEGVDAVDWETASSFGQKPGPAPDSTADPQEVGPGAGQPGSPESRDGNTPKSQEPG